MGLKFFRKVGMRETVEFCCSKCGATFETQIDECRKSNTTIFANQKLSCYFTQCPNCNNEVVLRCVE